MKLQLKQRNVTDLKQGERGIIANMRPGSLYLKLLEMGCLPGTEVSLKLPGDPLCITVGGHDLSLRVDEAQSLALVE
jgi:ferrous iron transport protein A